MEVMEGKEEGSLVLMQVQLQIQPHLHHSWSDLQAAEIYCSTVPGQVRFQIQMWF